MSIALASNPTECVAEQITPDQITGMFRNAEPEDFARRPADTSSQRRAPKLSLARATCRIIGHPARVNDILQGRASGAFCS